MKFAFCKTFTAAVTVCILLFSADLFGQLQLFSASPSAKKEKAMNRPSSIRMPWISTWPMTK